MINQGYSDEDLLADDAIMKNIVSMQNIVNIDHPLKHMANGSTRRMKTDPNDEAVDVPPKGVGAPSKFFDIRYDMYGNKIITSYIDDICEWNKDAAALMMFLLTEPKETTIYINANSIYTCSMVLIAMLNAIKNAQAKVIVDIRWSNIIGCLLAAAADEIVTNETSCIVFKQMRVVGIGSVEQAKQLITLSTDRVERLYQILLGTGLLVEEEYKKLSKDHDASIWLYGNMLTERVLALNELNKNR